MGLTGGGQLASPARLPDRFVSRNPSRWSWAHLGADLAMARPWISRRPRLQGLTEQGTDGARYKAESVYNESAPDIPAELHTVFIFRKAFLHRDAVGGRQWWERMEASVNWYLWRLQSWG
jgi:hypothetical protein